SRSFIEQLGPMYSMFETGRIAYAVIEALIMFLASFAIINTLMMALFERMREIGMLRSVGMTQRQLFLLFCIEGGLLGVVGGTAGAVAGSIVMWILSITGINFESAMQAVDWPVDYIIYPEMSIYYPIVAVIISVVVPVLASMLPAHAVRKYTPADALQK
ncbi:MAG: ABC transporter permease, partial [Spirochaetota bacterium]